MATLYEILGVKRDATAEQITQAFESQSDLGKAGEVLPEQHQLRLKAVKEAYTVLSSPGRRKAYDLKLANHNQVTWEEVRQTPFPWLQISLVITCLALGISYYARMQHNQSRIEQVAHEANRARAEADDARAEADEARAKADRIRLQAEADKARIGIEKDLLKERIEQRPASALTKSELTARSGEMYRGGSPVLSQSEMLSKVSFVSFSVVSTDPDKFVIDVQYNYDASAGPVDISAWVSSALVSGYQYSGKQLTPGQNSRIRINVERPSILPSFTTDVLTIVLKRPSSSEPILKKVYPWTHHWPEKRSF
jgi:curved DNA-binding protein CbpA